ncbi:DUF2946 family protein [Achromobacter sp. CF-sbj1-Ac2-l]|uniref:hypothetical protein n=1 Tax=Achromobacter TaxID=222 RepID=UPI00158295C4|nr:hypothetical protein [Achromobacter dolens]
MHTPVTFTSPSAATRRAVAWLAAALLVFQSLVASAAFGAPAPAASAGVSGNGASVILCTASGPRVVVLAADAPASPSAAGHDAGALGGPLPHCCASTCAMLGGACPPAPAGIAWRLPAELPALPFAIDVAPHPRGEPLWLPQQSRAPPRAA